VPSVQGATSVLIAEATRAGHDGVGVVESRHHGHVVVVGPDGPHALGDPDRSTLVRSAAKLFQATACLELLDREHIALRDDEIAIGSSSHEGEADHLAAVVRLLARAGLGPDDLTTPAVRPYSDPSVAPSRIAHNCSGKHALFALAGAVLGSRGADLLDPDDAFQRHVIAGVADVLGPADAVVIDGCGAPAVASPLGALARGMAQVAAGGRFARVRDAALAHPRLIGGTGRLETALLSQGVVAKPGAEGVFAAGWLDRASRPWGLAVKAEDGAARAADAMVIGLLSAAGVVEDGVWTTPAITGGGRPVGTTRASVAVLALAADVRDGCAR